MFYTATPRTATLFRTKTCAATAHTAPHTHPHDHKPADESLFLPSIRLFGHTLVQGGSGIFFLRSDLVCCDWSTRSHLDSDILWCVDELLSARLLLLEEQAEDKKAPQRAAKDGQKNDGHDGADGAARGTDSFGHGLLIPGAQGMCHRAGVCPWPAVIAIMSIKAARRILGTGATCQNAKRRGYGGKQKSKGKKNMVKAPVSGRE